MSEEPVRVLVVDDEPGLADLVAARLERESDRLDAVGVTSALAGLSLVDGEFDSVVDARALPDVEDPPWTGGVDCVVSDYDMPGMDGLEFLDAVRTVHPRLPFILYTGKGSEELASEAISRGVTDYLQKANSPDRYARLANRVEHAVGRRRAERALETKRADETEWMTLAAAVDCLPYVFCVLDEDGRLVRWNDRLVEVTGHGRAELEGATPGDLVVPADRGRLEPVGERGGTDAGAPVEARLRTSDGEAVPYEFHSVAFAAGDGRVRGRVLVGRDVTDRRALEDRTERLVQFAGTVAHDVRSTLNIARGRLSLLAEEVPDDVARAHLDPARRAVDRVGGIVVDAAEMADSGELGALKPTGLAAVADAAWEGVASGTDATLRVEDPVDLLADRSLLRLLLANLFHNTVEHAGEDVAVRVGALADGFYVADDGPGVAESDRERVFDWRFSTAPDGSGIGLASVRRIVELHGWTVSVDESESGGARVVVRGVETV